LADEKVKADKREQAKENARQRAIKEGRRTVAVPVYPLCHSMKGMKGYLCIVAMYIACL
jgi:hypothetical protein